MIYLTFYIKYLKVFSMSLLKALFWTYQPEKGILDYVGVLYDVFYLVKKLGDKPPPTLVAIVWCGPREDSVA